MKSLLIIAHRGASGYKPENTLAAFRAALKLNVNGIELDVHLSSDGVVMVIHDDTINRTTNGKGFVKNYTALELIKFGIPSLLQVLALVKGKCFVNIELKGKNTAKSVVDLISKCILDKKWEYSDFLISSFDWTMLEDVQKLDSHIRIGVLTDDNITEAVAFAKNRSAFSIHPNYEYLTKENVTLMQNNCFEVYTWTVNNKQDIEKIKTFNVNGIISDFPDKVLL